MALIDQPIRTAVLSELAHLLRREHDAFARYIQEETGPRMQHWEACVEEVKTFVEGSGLEARIEDFHDDTLIIDCFSTFATVDTQTLPRMIVERVDVNEQAE